MPKKRKTTAATKRAMPRLSASDEDDLINGMTKKQREEKGNRILHDIQLNGIFNFILPVHLASLFKANWILLHV